MPNKPTHACAPPACNPLQFCEGVSPGQASARDCLEDHMYEVGFSDGCRDKVEALVAERSGGGGAGWPAAECVGSCFGWSTGCQRVRSGGLGHGVCPCVCLLPFAFHHTCLASLHASPACLQPTSASTPSSWPTAPRTLSACARSALRWRPPRKPGSPEARKPGSPAATHGHR
jgi:hypothetical protein